MGQRLIHPDSLASIKRVKGDFNINDCLHWYLCGLEPHNWCGHSCRCECLICDECERYTSSVRIKELIREGYTLELIREEIKKKGKECEIGEMNTPESGFTCTVVTTHEVMDPSPDFVSMVRDKRAEATLIYADPGFDDKYNPDGCLFWGRRAAHSYTFCGKPRAPGLWTCDYDRDKIIGYCVNKGMKDGTLTPDMIREECRQERLKTFSS